SPSPPSPSACLGTQDLPKTASRAKHTRQWGPGPRRCSSNSGPMQPASSRASARIPHNPGQEPFAAQDHAAGFLLTGKEDFLEPYHQALARLDQQVRALKDKTQDNPRQQARIEELEGLSAERLALLKQGIDLRRKNAEEAQAFVATGQGKEKMDAIRRLIATMEAEEHELLRDRER